MKKPNELTKTMAHLQISCLTNGSLSAWTVREPSNGSILFEMKTPVSHYKINIHVL